MRLPILMFHNLKPTHSNLTVSICHAWFHRWLGRAYEKEGMRLFLRCHDCDGRFKGFMIHSIMMMDPHEHKFSFGCTVTWRTVGKKIWSMKLMILYDISVQVWIPFSFYFFKKNIKHGPSLYKNLRKVIYKAIKKQ